MMEYSLHSIAAITRGSLKGEPDTLVSHILTDSRSLFYPHQTLFVALVGRNNGHDYIEELYLQGIRSFLVSEYKESFGSLADASFLIVDNTLDALQALAKEYRSRFHIPVIGITGSNGKTIEKEWLYQLLKESFLISRSPRSYNSQIGVPLSLLQMNPDAELAIIEAGISQKGEMHRLADMIRPDIGVFTHLGSAHGENFTDKREKCLEKMDLFEHSKVLIYGKDDDLLQNCVLEKGWQEKAFVWSEKDESADLWVDSVERERDITRIACRYKGIRFSFCFPFTDNAALENSLTAVAVCLYLGISAETLSLKTPLLEPVEMRLEVKPGIRDCIVVNDSYNSDLSSLAVALEFLFGQTIDPTMKRTLILSDIRQTEETDEELYRKVGQLLKEKRVDRLIGIGSRITAQGHLFDMPKAFYPSTEVFLSLHITSSFEHEAILIKGARDFKLEAISQRLEKKQHTTILEVNLDAVVHNLNYFRSKLSPGVKTICMVKAFGYGAGAVELVKTLQHHRVDYVAVAVADEGVELRHAGVTIPIIVMNPEPSCFALLFEYSLEPEVYSFTLLQALLEEGEKNGVTHFPIHIKIDTGMHRLGFEIQEIPLLLSVLSTQNRLKVSSLFSHLAGADDPDLDDFTDRQAALFAQACALMQEELPYSIQRHILNSAGIERFGQYQYDMVRLGVGLYGISFVDQEKLRPISTLKSTILQIKTVRKGETVGYGRKGQINRDSRIAVLPIGYADGLNRRLGNSRFFVWINGYRAPIVGNICMDLCMIDVTDIECKEGDTAEIFGQHITLCEVAHCLDTIPYEVLTSVSARVKRIYYKE